MQRLNQVSSFNFSAQKKNRTHGYITHCAALIRSREIDGGNETRMLALRKRNEGHLHNRVVGTLHHVRFIPFLLAPSRKYLHPITLDDRVTAQSEQNGKEHE
jgi:hypothetical protein